MMSKPNLQRIKLIKKPGAFDFQSGIKAEVIALNDTVILRIKDETKSEQVDGSLIEAEFISKSGLSVGDILTFNEEGVATEQQSTKPAKQVKVSGQGCSRAPINM